MRESVSNDPVWAGASVISMSILLVFFVLPGTGSVSGGLLGILTFAAALLVAMWAMRTLAQAIHGLGAEPVRAPVLHSARPARSAV